MNSPSESVDSGGLFVIMFGMGKEGKRAPSIKIALQAELKIVQEAIEAWARFDPQEATNYRLEMALWRQKCAVTGGWSKSRELLVAARFPAFVYHMVTRKLKFQLGWEPEKAQKWQVDSNTGGTSKLFRAAIKQLLPEADPTTAEGRKYTHKGWSPDGSS